MRLSRAALARTSPKTAVEASEDCSTFGPTPPRRWLLAMGRPPFRRTAGCRYSDTRSAYACTQARLRRAGSFALDALSNAVARTTDQVPARTVPAFT